MATELIRVSLCDQCLTDSDTRTPSDFSATVTVDGKALQIDLCADHATAVLIGLGLVRQYGNPAAASAGQGGRPSDPEAPVQCPVCPNRYQHQSSLRAHLRKTHNLSAGEYRKLMPGATQGSDMPCPDCNFIAVSSVGLAAHRRLTHPTEYAQSRNAGS